METILDQFLTEMIPVFITQCSRGFVGHESLWPKLWLTPFRVDPFWKFAQANSHGNGPECAYNGLQRIRRQPA